MNASPPDLQFLNRLCKGDRQFMSTFIRQYLTDSPGLLRELAHAVADGDATALLRAAHDLRPQAHYMGAVRMEQLLIEADRDARKQPPVLRKDLVEEVLPLAAGLETELRAWRNEQRES